MFLHGHPGPSEGAGPSTGGSNPPVQPGTARLGHSAGTGLQWGSMGAQLCSYWLTLEKAPEEVTGGMLFPMQTDKGPRRPLGYPQGADVSARAGGGKK